LVSTEADGTVCYAVRTFGTMTDEVLALADWLTAQEVSHVAMASTGVSWNLVWNLLDDGFGWLLVHARHGLDVPWRTLDIHECA
jgi:transposase